jgi:hypothetical protein
VADQIDRGSGRHGGDHGEEIVTESLEVVRGRSTRSARSPSPTEVVRDEVKARLQADEQLVPDLLGVRIAVNEHERRTRGSPASISASSTPLLTTVRLIAPSITLTVQATGDAAPSGRTLPTFRRCLARLSSCSEPDLAAWAPLDRGPSWESRSRS